LTRTICKTEEREESVLIKIRENGETKFYDVPFNNYFFIKAEDFETANFWIKNYIKEEETFINHDGIAFSKVYLNDNTKRYYVQSILNDKEIEHYEIDVPADKRILLDKFNKLHQENLRFTFIDIETYDMKPLVKNMMGRVEGNQPILSFAGKDLDNNSVFFRNEGLDNNTFTEYKERYLDFMDIRKKIETINNNIFEIEKKTELTDEDRMIISQEKDKRDELMTDFTGLRRFLESHEELVLTYLFVGEKKLLEKYAEYIKNYDVALAYNGWGFDFPYLKDRFEKHNMNYDNLFIIDSDYMQIVMANTYGERNSNALQSVAEDELGGEYEEFKKSNDDDLDENELTPELDGIEDVGKIDWKSLTNAKKYFELFLCYPQIEKEYNIQDVNLLCLIENKLNLLTIHTAICDECNCLFNDSIFNSKSLDYVFLNKYRENKLVSPSKPSKLEMDRRKDKFNGVFPGGGYTYVYKRGLHKNLICNDFKSFYPTTVITYEISPESFVKSVRPNLNLIFNYKEIDYLIFAQTITKKHLDAQGKIKTKPYEKELEEYRLEHDLPTLNDLMFKFAKEYENKELLEECKRNGWTMTPGDINYDTRGWKVYPHYVFKKGIEKRNIFPEFVLHTIETRDKKKYEKNKFEVGTHEYESMDKFEKAIKKLSNAAYGYFVFKNCRYFMEEVANAITSSCRCTIKKSILLLEEKENEVTNGDTDSCYYKIGRNRTIEENDKDLFDYYKELAKNHNCSANVEINDPHKINHYNHCKKELQEIIEDYKIQPDVFGYTEEEENQYLKNQKRIEKVKRDIEVLSKHLKSKSDHFIVFEYEKTFESCIVVAKKRYYFKQKKPNGKYKYSSKGGAYIKTDSLKMAGDMQKELCKDILDEKFQKEVWLDKIMSMRQKVFDNKLPVEDLIKIKGLKRPIHEYGKPMIDKDTQKQKKTKDGKLRFAPIPAHVQVADRMENNGEIVDLNDKIKYIVKERIGSSKKIVPISPMEFVKEKIYDAEYYWGNFESVLREILEVVYPDLVDTYFEKCWNNYYKVKKKKKKKKVAK
jgi:DNA polymerase elongation subunit (family B)